MDFDDGLDPDPADAAGVPWGPDALGLVLEVDTMMAVFAAQRYERVDAMRREAAARAAAARGAADAAWMPQIGERSLRLELAAAMRVSEFAAGALLTQAEALVHRYPAVLDALAGARVTEQHARVLIELVDTVEPELRGEVVPRAVELAESLPVGSFRRALRNLVDTVRSATLAERHTEALQERRVVVEPAENGMAWLSALIPAVDVHAGHNRVTAIAKALAAREGETRTLDQLRADVFGDILVEGEVMAHPDEAHGIRATVAVTVPVLALLDDADDSDESDCSGGARRVFREPARVEGIGPIPIGRARELCGGAAGWMRILTHPETGTVLSVGREQYRPPPSLRRLVRWRAERCMAPGCGIPASRCEIDHTIAWEHGGETALENLAPLCKGHHTVKHHGDWHVKQQPGSGGALEWTSPTGRRYIVHPERRVPAFTMSEDPPPF